MIGKDDRGFTLLEILAVVFLFSLIIVIASSFYISGQRIYSRSISKMEIAQNARVVYDRLSREIRQSEEIVTMLASSSASSTDEIFFEDGHDSEDISYVYYYKSGNDLRRAILAYYFDEEPDVYVRYDSLDEDDNFPEQATLEDRIVAEYLSGIEFWRENGVIKASSTFRKDNSSFNLQTGISSRNN